jgi:hypothetical protein
VTQEDFTSVMPEVLFEISGSQGIEYEDERLLGCCADVVSSKMTEVSEVLAASIIRAVMTLIMEAVSTSETSVNFHETTRCSISEDDHLYVLFVCD